MDLMATQTLSLDIEEGTEYRVLIFDCRNHGAEPHVFFDGTTRFTIDPMPNVRRLGQRWALRPTCMPNLEAIGGDPGKWCPDYAPGRESISFGESYLLYFLDRHDPRVWHAESARRTAEAVGQFFQNNGIESITFEEDQR